MQVGAGDCTQAPEEGARVILDAPDGQRVEALTDGSGEARFEGLDFDLGTASVTVTKDGHDIVSYVGLTAERSPLEVALWTPRPVKSLSGQVTNMLELEHQLIVDTTLCSRNYYGHQQVGSSYTIQVPTGEPFSLFSLEFSAETLPSGQGYSQTFYQWLWQDREAMTESTTLDFELDELLSPESVTGAFFFDLREDSPLAGDRGRGYVVARAGSHVNSMSFGFPALIDINTDATGFDYTVEHAPSALIDNPLTEYWVTVADGSSADKIRVYEAGFPRAGDHSLDFIDVPKVTPPPSDGEVYPLANQTWSWELYNEGVTPFLAVFVPTTDYYWSIYGPEDSTEFTIPELPEDLELLSALRENDAQALFVVERGGAGLLAGTVDALTNTDVIMVRYE
ncbi:MAG: carboxypeptidase regulatory-like domain-containing protein [Myxococcales bacterium]|nr:carboxypeptidase regulatory-like domain-containing protein [Myxococcales bacterium]MCB9752965.1 carboxypeptidase regulatory-like domain-containing protein [Myxococcales bacterium]